MSVNLECVGCRKIKEFSEPVDFPVCEICQAYERGRQDERKVWEITTPDKKEPISDLVRWKVFMRDNFTCQKCGSHLMLTADHIYPESLGGSSDMSNLQTLCKSCNSEKGARP
jgi:5-methylcytosine-specific restriction endonuclease McrA